MGLSQDHFERTYIQQTEKGAASLAKTKKSPAEPPAPRASRPALTPEGRENQMIALAVDVVEERMRNGTATAAEIIHFLKLGSSKEKLEQEVMELQKELLAAKTEAIRSTQDLKELYDEAMRSMTEYQGNG